MTAIPVWRRIPIAKIATAVLLGLALLAAADLGFTALAVILSTVNPQIGLIGDAGAVLSYFTFYPSVLVAALTLIAGALIAWRNPSLTKLGIAVVITGILSAAFVAVALLPHALR
ncbi:hypothetical protein [Glaciihabitans sp. GrIS 2.15]|uniref:hypothetical protein n=1 Tax=Glaciihabitans sp. GrIS 2.15 TaxID=3071710 RepID=UPI002E06CF3A|nr:hypothetical protein [Glaciihabitans sp. GrIS 2.15]